MSGACSEACEHEKKAKWPVGPWTTEPDRVDFRHAGLPCILHRGFLGAWCGYVGVPPGHPWHGKEFEGVEASVHGGLTYSGKCDGPICHVPEPGEPDDIWWFGFDLAHAFDLAPEMLVFSVHRFRREIYRDIAYARRETERLAEQFAAVTAAAAAPR